jgi:hypothetical protein
MKFCQSRHHASHPYKTKFEMSGFLDNIRDDDIVESNNKKHLLKISFSVSFKFMLHVVGNNDVVKREISG